MKTIATALAEAQASMGKALKQSNNPHFRSKYADLGNVMDACLPSLNAVGIALIQPTGEDEHGRFVETILIHGESGESLSCRVPLIVAKNDMQGYGSAVTYARRYGLMAMAGIAPEDDDANAAANAAPKQEQRQQKPQEIDADHIAEAARYLGNAESLDDLKSRWQRLPKAVQRIAAVVEAKDKARAGLDAATGLEDPPLTDDEIPF